MAMRQFLPCQPLVVSNAVRANSGVVAFVQNRASGEVLQALMLQACPG